MKPTRMHRSHFSAIKWIPVWVALISAISQIATAVISRL
jgi:hypothetical protein